jgi:molybdopterin molybdotransferase
MSGSLSTVDALLTPILARLRAVDATLVPTRAANGMWLAADLVTPDAVPTYAIALRSGFAVASLDIAGASMHAPALLMSEPRHIAAGEPLPTGCDAIIDSDAVSRAGAVWEIAESVEPGMHVRLPGHDLARGAVIASAGSRVTPEIALAAELAGVHALAVRRPSIALEGFAEPETEWLTARLHALGITRSEHALPQVIIRATSETRPRLALRPGDTAWIKQEGASIVVEAPNRFDGVVGVWCALVLPLLARLLDQPLQGLDVELTRKVTSAIGFAEVALFRRHAGRAAPLAVGDLPLSAIAATDVWCIVPSDLEGYPQSATVSLISIDQPFKANWRS